jgi:transcriptional regulator with XRE-family HTH domain
MPEMMAYCNHPVKGFITPCQFRWAAAGNTLGPMLEWQKRLKNWMAEAEVTQDYLAGRMSRSQGTIAHWLSGRREINLSDFLQMCEFAGADPQYILFGAIPRENPADLELNKLLVKFPELKARVATPPVSNDAVAAALGPLPPRRAKRATRKKRVKT